MQIMGLFCIPLPTHTPKQEGLPWYLHRQKFEWKEGRRQASKQGVVKCELEWWGGYGVNAPNSTLGYRPTVAPNLRMTDAGLLPITVLSNALS